MLGKYIFFFLIICVISQVKCQNSRNEDKSPPPSFFGELLRSVGEFKRLMGTWADKTIYAFKLAFMRNTGGLFGGFKKLFGGNDKLSAEQRAEVMEAEDMNMRPDVEVFTKESFPNNNYNGRPIRRDFIYKLINDLCAEGRYIPDICN